MLDNVTDYMIIRELSQIVDEGYRHGSGSIVDHIARVNKKTDYAQDLRVLLDVMIEYHNTFRETNSFWFGKELPKRFEETHKAVADLVYLTEVAWNIHVCEMDYLDSNAHAEKTLSDNTNYRQTQISEYHPFLTLIDPLKRKNRNPTSKLSPWTSKLLKETDKLGYPTRLKIE